MKRSIVVAALMIGLLAGLNACSKKEGEAPSSAPSYSGTSLPSPAAGQPGLPEASGTPVAAPAKFDTSLVGTLNNNIEIQMAIVRDGEAINGTYFYETVREPLELSGKIAKDGAVTLTESTNSGNQTGLFKGRLYGQEMGGDVRLIFEGTWSKPNGDKAVPVMLREKRFDLGGGRKFVAKAIDEENKKEHYEIEVSYPQIEGLGEVSFANFNKLVAGLITKNVAAFKKSAPEAFDTANPEAQPSGYFVSYDITLANENLISILFDGSEYSSGAAHPNPFSWTLNYDLKNNREIKLRELFNANASYLQAISSYCQKALTTKLKKQEMDNDEMIREGAAPKAENFQSWNITSKGLLFTFDPYQVAAYAAGPQEVLIPYSALKELLRSDSPVAPLFDNSVLQ